MISLVISQYKTAALKFKRFTIPPLVIAAPARILVEYIPPLFIAHILNSLTTGQHTSLKELMPWVIAFIVAPFVGELLWRTIFWFLNRADALVMEYLSKKVFSTLIEREFSFHANNYAGALVAKTNRYVGAFEPLFDTIVLELSGMLIPTAFALVVLATISWQIVAIFLVVFSIYLTILITLTRKRLVMTKDRAALESKQTAQLADSISNATTVKTFASEAYEKQRFAKVTKELTSKRLETWDYQNIPIDVITTNTIIGLNGIAVVGAIIAYNYAGISAGAIYIIITYTLQLTSKFWNIGRIIRNLETNLGNASEMAELLMQPTMVTDVANNKDNTRDQSKKGITFDKVSFCYEDDTNALFNNLSFSIKPGEKVGLVGTSGGGKTTLTKLLLRFYDINSGTISIDGQSISAMKQAELRSLISYVPQEPALFHRTIKENITYAKPVATDAELLAVAKQSHVSEFVDKLPLKYETLVGERGVKLSGGQRQRVAIARAMLKDASILLLDEATSALDSGSEALIQDALWKLMKNRTTLVIAHRLSTIQKMDRIIVLDNGTIIEQGSHAELLAKKGTYATLWAHQSGGFLA